VYDLSLLLNISMGIVLVLLIFYFYIKDNNIDKQLKGYEFTIDEIAHELFSLKKAFREYEKGYSKIAGAPKPKDGTVNYDVVDDMVKKSVNTYVNDALNPFLDSVHDLDISITSLKGSMDSRLNELSDKIRFAVHSKIVNEKSYDDKKLEQLSKNGRAKKDIARELNANKGEVDFMLKMAKFKNKK
jgi:hypothetical protein